MISHELPLMPIGEDEKRWMAEITGDDETFVLKRDFQPEIRPGVWEIYDGWYQIHGQFPGISPFEKEYVLVQNGQMTRHLDFRYMISALPQIKAYEEQRKERLAYQITKILDEIYEAVPYDGVSDAILSQKEDMSMVESSSELVKGLANILKQKDDIIKKYQTYYDQAEDLW